MKNREYAARGIPFIYSETDSDFDNKPYVLKGPADESPTNIQDIIDFSFIEQMELINWRDSKLYHMQQALEQMKEQENDGWTTSTHRNSRWTQ